MHQFNGDIASNKSLYFEAVSELFEPGKIEWFVWQVLYLQNSHNLAYFNNFRIKLSTHSYFQVLFHSIRSNI